MDFKKNLTLCTSIVSAIIGHIFIPCLTMAVAQFIDYSTGVLAAFYSGEKLSARKGMRGIIKKIALWICVLVSMVLDMLLMSTCTEIGITYNFRYFLSALVSIWITLNELLSILENLIKLDVQLPKFLQPLVKNIISKVDRIAEDNELDSKGNR